MTLRGRWRRLRLPLNVLYSVSNGVTRPSVARKRRKLSRLMNPSELYETIRNRAGVDVALQLHCNSVNLSERNGVSAYIRTTGDWVAESRAIGIAK